MGVNRAMLYWVFMRAGTCSDMASQNAYLLASALANSGLCRRLAVHSLHLSSWLYAHQPCMGVQAEAASAAAAQHHAQQADTEAQAAHGRADEERPARDSAREEAALLQVEHSMMPCCTCYSAFSNGSHSLTVSS